LGVAQGGWSGGVWGSHNKSCPKQWATFLVVSAAAAVAAATTYIKQLHIFCMR